MSVPNLSTTREERLYQEQIEDLQELALDPTLQSCCQRDLEDQIRIAKYKALLTPQDRSQARNRLAGQVVATPAGINGSDDDEDDAELDALRQRRVQELQAQLRKQRLLQSENHGAVSSVPEAKLMDIINESAADYVVCHITVEGDAAGEAFDEHLELLARQFLGTRFIRCPVQPNSQLPLHFGLEFPSGVICFHRGDLIGSMLLDREADGEAHDPDVIESWLRRKGCVVSLEGAADVPNRPGHDPTAAADASEDEGDDEPCEVCGRRYPHQHIRSVYRTTVDDSDND